MKSHKLNKTISLIALAALQTYFFVFPAPLESSNLGTMRDTLSTSRISVAARIDATGTTVGSSAVKIKSTASGNFQTTTTNNLRIGDSISINANTYTIIGLSTTDSTVFTVDPVIQSGDATDNSPVYLKSKPMHWIQFDTASAIANGFFRVLVPAASSNSNDGSPDITGFDFGGGTITATASSVTGYNFAYIVATASGGTGCTSPANYHCFEFHYAGSGGIGTGLSFFIGQSNGTNSLIAPAPANTTEASAETYGIIVTQYNNSGSQVDASTGRVGLIESVRLSATVDPTITFAISGRSGTSCGVAPDINTTSTPLAVPFGSMSLNTFKNAAHQLTVSTNAANGYAVTAIENDQMGKDGDVTPNIADTTCDGGSCTHTTSANWATPTNNGLGYAIENVDAATVSATYKNYNELARSFSAKQFPASIEGESPETIMSSSTVANAEDVYVCYRLTVGATQAAGDYQNQVTYTATARF